MSRKSKSKSTKADSINKSKDKTLKRSDVKRVDPTTRKKSDEPDAITYNQYAYSVKIARMAVRKSEAVDSITKSECETNYKVGSTTREKKQNQNIKQGDHLSEDQHVVFTVHTKNKRKIDSDEFEFNLKKQRTNGNDNNNNPINIANIHTEHLV